MSQETQKPQWIDQAQTKAELEAQKLSRLYKDRLLFQAENITEGMVRSYIESYHAALEPLFMEMQDAGWKIDDNGIAKRQGKELGERFDRKKLLEKYPLSDVREERWGIMDLNSNYFLDTFSQSYFIVTADQRLLAMVHLTPVSNERSHLGGIEITIENTNVHPNKEAPQTQEFKLQVGSPEELTVNMDGIKARIEEVLVHRELLNTWKAEEERKFLEKQKIAEENNLLAQKIEELKEKSIIDTIIEAGRDGISLIEISEKLQDQYDIFEIRDCILNLERVSPGLECNNHKFVFVPKKKRKN